MNIINYAVADIAALDAKVDELINGLLSRPQHALQRTKRLMNKHIIQQWNLAYDLSSAFEYLDFDDHTRAGNVDDHSWSPEKNFNSKSQWWPNKASKA